MAEKSGAPNHRKAPGNDRCDSCFHRHDMGASCSRHGHSAADGYAPNNLCDDFSPRSIAQKWQDENGAKADEQKPAEKLTEEKPEKAYAGQTLTNVEILRVGTWNGIKFTGADIDAMVKAYGEMGFTPPVKLGHDDDPKAPAWGWVTSLRREGDVLLATFSDVPDELVTWIQDGRYDACSIEFWTDYKRDGKEYRRALKAVAVLGAHPPAVGHLEPLRSVAAGLADGAEAASITVPREEKGMTTKPNDGAPAGGAVDAAAMADAEAKIQKLQADLAAAQARAQVGEDAALQIKRLSETVTELQAVNARTLEERRQERLTGYAASCKIPAFKDHVRALADALTREGAASEVKFAASAETPAVPTAPLKVLEDLIERMNGKVDVLFREAARGGDMAVARAELGGAEDPGAVLYNKASELAAKEGIAFDVALSRVRSNPANRDLVAAYAKPAG